MRICRQLLSALVIPKDEFRASRRQEAKLVPAEVVPLTTRLGKNVTYERVIEGTLTGLPTNYEQDGGNWIVNHAALDAEYEAQKKFREPVKVSDNILVTALGIVEL